MSSHTPEQSRSEDETLQRSMVKLENARSVAELAETAEKWRSLIATIPDFILIVNRDGSIRYINHTVAGFEMKDVLGAPCFEFVDPTYHGRLRQSIEHVFSTEQLDEGEIIGVGPNGTWLWYSFRAGPFYEQGHIAGVTVVANDITGKKRTEQALLEQTQYSAHIVTSAPTLICGISPEGVTRSVNAAVTKVTGYAPEEIIGQNWWNVFYPGKQYQQVEKLFEDLAKGPVANYDMVLTTKHGAQRTISWNSVNRFDAADSLLEIIGIGADITERKLAEERLRDEQQLLRKLLDLQERERQFVSHEIHDGFLQYAVSAKLTLEAAMHRLTATDGGDTLSEHEHIKDLLGKAIAEGRRLIGELRPLIIDEQGIVEAIRHLVAEVTYVDDIDVEFRHDVHFDRLEPMLESALFRIVQEAITNVKRHSRCNHAEIELTEQNGQLVLEIQDHGVGFQHDQMPNGRFGLRGITERARLFDGTATIDTAPGQGTRICVQLPIKLAEDTN